MAISRRKFMQQSGLMLAFSVAGAEILLTPAQAYAKQATFKVLSADEVEILEAAAELFLPGAKQAGIAHFIDQQLNIIDANNCLLVLKYFDFPPPYNAFYHSALSGLEKLSQSMFDKSITKLNSKQGTALIESIRDAKAENWEGPPPPLVYHVMRNDAIDVVYGTVEGFEKLGIPYMEHILPVEKW